MTLGVCLLLGAGARPAAADGFENIPTGAKTAAMGGAAIAGGSDSAMPTLNPAGLALIPGSILSISASLYQLGAVTIPGYVTDDDSIDSQWGALGVSQRGIASREFSTFPSGLSYFLHIGAEDQPIILAASLSVPRNVRRRFVQNVEFLGEGVSIKDNITTVLQEQSYLGAFSGATAFGPVRVGASALIGYASVFRSVDRSSLTVLGTADFNRFAVKESQTAFSTDAAGLGGVQVDLLPWLKVGASVRSPSIHLGGGLEGSVDQSGLAGGGTPVISTVQTQGEATFGMPLRLGLGVLVDYGPWAVALDGKLYLPRQDEVRQRGISVNSSIGGTGVGEDEHNFDGFVPTENVVNVALGVELQITDVNWLRVGAFTDFSANEPTDKIVQAEQRMNMGRDVNPNLLFKFPMARFGGSLGWGTRVGPVDTTVGLHGSYGRGDTIRPGTEERLATGGGGRLGPAQATEATVLDVIAFVSAALDVSESASSLFDNVTSNKKSGLIQ